jgi:hypothetical protein
MQAMLEHVAREATTGGYDLIATLAAGAAEAARQELAARENVDRRRTPTQRKDRVAVLV